MEHVPSVRLREPHLDSSALDAWHAGVQWAADIAARDRVPKRPVGRSEAYRVGRKFLRAARGRSGPFWRGVRDYGRGLQDQG